jgi:methylmalonyl-CoA/ethylmalonyl-CoA epimerase
MKRIEHIGIAVADLRAAEQIFEDVLGESAFKREQVESEGVEVSFFQTGESKVELLASTTPEGPIGQHIA